MRLAVAESAAEPAAKARSIVVDYSYSVMTICKEGFANVDFLAKI